MSEITKLESEISALTQRVKELREKEKHELDEKLRKQKIENEENERKSNYLQVANVVTGSVDGYEDWNVLGVFFDRDRTLKAIKTYNKDYSAISTKEIRIDYIAYEHIAT